ncbi:MAG: sigma-70 family RNA polymerase sigma factor [Bacteroidales bacterium]|nr:sigma-70 family RNA polymerase sigma factor [Bacteroidales bacterium]
MTNKSVAADLEIKERYLTDRKEGFRLLYQKYSDRILAVCRRYSSDSDEALDCFQEAMLDIDRKFRSYEFQGEGSLKRWMTRVTVNKIIDGLRKKARKEVVDFPGGSDNLVEPTPSYEETESVPLEEMYRMIERLSPVKRAVFNMFCIEGYSHKEIGASLGISEKGSSSLLSKARKELAGMVTEYLKRNK